MPRPRPFALRLRAQKHSETRLVVLSCLLALSDVIAALPSVRLALCPHVPWLVALQLQNTANSPLQVSPAACANCRETSRRKGIGKWEAGWKKH